MFTLKSQLELQQWLDFFFSQRFTLFQLRSEHLRESLLTCCAFIYFFCFVFNVQQSWDQVSVGQKPSDSPGVASKFKPRQVWRDSAGWRVVLSVSSHPHTSAFTSTGWLWISKPFMLPCLTKILILQM